MPDQVEAVGEEGGELGLPLADVGEEGADGAADEQGCPQIVTTGDSSPAPRDVTPEVTEAMYDRVLPGFGEVARAVSLHTAPMAILSRQTTGTRGLSQIVSLSGKLSAVAECLDPVLPASPCCIDLIDGQRLVTDLATCVGLRPEGA